ncbi:putative 5-formyltetrahydrofolate cyclo-ligase, mitochondrial [Sesbania bispinosa]|nr:putative 5-formyltetrahydrofolate cyclo-ligase, mitochondrial [Sesbania bispinosa]
MAIFCTVWEEILAKVILLNSRCENPDGEVMKKLLNPRCENPDSYMRGYS